MILRLSLIVFIIYYTLGCIHYPPETQSCRVSCVNRYQACQLSCHNSCKPCALSAAVQAERSFKRYVHEHYVEGKRVVRELKSYRDPLQCRKFTCDCVADYHVCREACGGIIHKQLQVVPICQ